MDKGLKMISLIAEIGCNWDKFSTALRLIKESKQSGASHVKFQLFSKETIEGSPHFDRLNKMILCRADVARLKKEAEEQEIGFILTPMYLEAVEMADEFCDEYIKIRYADHENQELIDKAMDTGKTLLISVPYLPLEAYKMFHPRIKYFYCIPKYPPEIEDFNLEVSVTCQGFSSHFPDTICDLAWAVNRSHQDAFLEKHVMLKYDWEKTPSVDIAYPQKRKPPIDEAVSISFQKLAKLKGQLDKIERMKRIRL